ncbi:MAG: phytochelatin synthase family protein [Legionella sp.]|nr:phytochelatin synthase family protein [Legionella sp.]
MSTPFNKMLKLYLAGFRQTTEATCGPASVILATQSLGLDIKQECEWRNSEFKPWMPVDQFMERGMALHELEFISELIFVKQIDVKATRAYPENFPVFLKDIKTSFNKENSVVIVNYRQTDFIKHQGVDENPHYSPLVAWDKDAQKICVADVDPLVKEPYWVSIDDMFQSMSHSNFLYHLPRGWLVLYRRKSNLVCPGHSPD